MRKLAMIGSGFALVLLASGGCSRAIKPEGTYAFRTNNFSEKIELRSGGGFTQTIYDSGLFYTNSGRWALENSRILTLRPFLVRFDTRLERMMAPTGYTLYDGRLERGGMRISFDDDGKYFLVREK